MYNELNGIEKHPIMSNIDEICKYKEGVGDTRVLVLPTHDKIMYKNGNYDNTNVNKHSEEELTQLLALEYRYLDQPILLGLEELISDYYKYLDGIFRDKAYHYHAKFVIKQMKLVAKEVYGNEDFRQGLLDRKFTEYVIEKMVHTKSFVHKRRPLLQHFYAFYYSNLNLSPLSPERESIFSLIKSSGAKHITGCKHEPYINHPSIEEFLAYLTEKNQMWHKRARLHLTTFLKWLVDKGYFESVMEIDVSDIDFEMLLEFREHLNQKRRNKLLKKESAQSYLQSIRNWFRMLKIKGRIISNPASKLKNFKVTKVEDNKPLFTIEETERFFQAILISEEPLKWYLIFSMIASMGLRSNELLSITPEDINLETGEVFVRRKWHKDQTLPIPSLSLTLIKAYMKHNTEHSEILWTNKSGRRLSYERLRIQFHKYLTIAGINNIKGGAHNFRHLLLSELCYQHADLLSLKVLADVKSVKALNPYIKARNSDVFHEFQDRFVPIGVDSIDTKD